VTNARSSLTDTAQTAAEKAAGAVGSVLGNDTVESAVETVGDLYRRYPLLSKIAIGTLVAIVGTAVVRRSRR